MKVKNENELYVDKLYECMLTYCSYIIIERSVVESFVAEFGVIEDEDRALDMLRDYILSQGLEDDVVE